MRFFFAFFIAVLFACGTQATPTHTCQEFSSTNFVHSSEGRAFYSFYMYYAEGSSDYLGYSWQTTTLSEVLPGHYVKGSCPESIPVADIGTVVERLIHTYEPFSDTGVVVAVVDNYEVVYTEAFGLRDRASGLAVDLDTTFAIGSTTKAMTGHVMLTAHDVGLYDIHNPIKHYLTDFQLLDSTVESAITGIDLLSHKTGLPSHDQLWYYSDLTRQELYGALAHLPYPEGEDPVDAYHSKPRYNNLMYMTSAVLLEIVSGNTWEQYVASHLFEPLGMDNSQPLFEDVAGQPNVAKAYFGDVELPGRVGYKAVAPAGSVQSTIGDMSKWLRYLVRGGITENDARVISETNWPIYFEKHLDGGSSGYGLGWTVIDNSGAPIIQHTGYADGYSAMVSFFRNHGMGVVILANQESAKNLVENVTYGVYEYLVNGTVPDEAENIPSPYSSSQGIDAETGLTSVQIEQYLGEYNHASYKEIQMLSENGNLVVSFFGNKWIFEKTSTADEFTFGYIFKGFEWSGDAVFKRDTNGNINNLSITFYGNPRVEIPFDIVDSDLPANQCISYFDKNSVHKDAGRAVYKFVFGRGYGYQAVGTNEWLGYYGTTENELVESEAGVFGIGTCNT